MRILDNYIIRNFLGTLLFALIAFSVIYIIIDVVGFMDKFIDRNVGLLIVIKYYIYYLPYIIILTLPVATLLASLFSVGQLSRYNELIAMQASGISLYRILHPLIVLGVIISLVAAYAGERFVPSTNQKKKEIYQAHVNKVKRRDKDVQTRDINLQIDKNRWLLIGFFDIDINTGFQVSVQTYYQNQLIKRIDAAKMIWKDENRWQLLNGNIRQFENKISFSETFDLR